MPNFTTTGFAFVKVELRHHCTAPTAEDALRMALRQFNESLANLVLPGTADFENPIDWAPFTDRTVEPPTEG